MICFQQMSGGHLLHPVQEPLVDMLLYNKRRRIAGALATVLSAGGSVEINTTAPAITPTLGAELIVNGGFDSDASSWTAGGSATLASIAGGQSGNCLQITNGSFGSAGQTLPALTVGAYYQFLVYQKNGLAGGIPRWGINPSANEYVGIPSTQANWTLKTFIARVTSATSNLTLIVNSAAGSQTSLFDGASVKLLTDTQALLGDILRKSGTFVCHPTVAQFSVCGMDINYLDGNNLVRAVVHRTAPAGGATDTAKLLKRVSGTWTEVVSGTVTYSAAAELKVIVSGTTFQLWYNGVQVGTNQTIDNSGLGTKVYGFNTLAGNTVGTVTTSP